MRIAGFAAVLLAIWASGAFGQWQPKDIRGEVTVERGPPSPGPAPRNFDPPAKAEGEEIAPASVGLNKWLVSQSKSRLDDRPVVTLVQIGARLNPDPSPDLRASWVISCRDNRTNVFFAFTGVTLGAYRNIIVAYRFDQGAVVNTFWPPTTDGSATGPYSGPSAIAFSREAMKAKTLVLRATSRITGRYEAEFRIVDLAEAITPLREACGW